MKDSNNNYIGNFENELKKDKSSAESFKGSQESNSAGPKFSAEDIAELRALMERYAPGAATEEDRKRFGAATGAGLLDMTEAQREEMLLSGRRVLREQMKDLPEDKERSRTAALSAEKVLFLCDTESDRWYAAEKLMVAHSKHGLTMITKSSQKRTLEGLLSSVPDALASIRNRVSALPETGSRKKQIFNLVLFFAMLVVMALVHFHPALAALFTEENVYDALVAVGAIATIVMFFVGGFWGAVAFLVIFALILTGLQAIMPIAMVGKLLVFLILGLIAFFSFRGYAKESKKLRPATRKRRADEIAALKAEAATWRTYTETIVKQVDAFLKEDEPKQNGRDDETKEHHHEIQVYIRQYRDKMQSYARDLANVVPYA